MEIFKEILLDFWGRNKKRLPEMPVISGNESFRIDFNYDRGIAAYHFNSLYVESNEAHDNQATGINILDCQNGTLKNNNTYNNNLRGASAYDIWLNGCSGFTISGNTYGTKSGF